MQSGTASELRNIHLAAQNGDLETVKYLISQGIDINKKNNYGDTPLNLAALSGHLEVVQCLVNSQNVDVNKVDNGGRTALHWAALRGHLEAVQCLVNSKNVDVNKVDRGGSTALHWAALRGHLGVVQCFINSQNVDVNKIDRGGCTALHQAVFCDQLEVIQCLVNSKNVDVNKVDRNSRTALHWVALRGHLEIVQCLVNTRNVDVNKVDNDGRTALHWAALKGHLKVVQCLVNTQNVDVNKVDRNGYTALHLAVQCCRSKDVAKFLIKYKVKLQPSGVEKPSYLVQPNSHFARGISEYWDRCLDEIKRMEEEKIDRDITFYDIFTNRDTNRLVYYMQNENVVKKLKEKDNYKEEFPIYADEIESQYNKGKERAALLNEGSNNFFNVCKGKKEGPTRELPKEVCEKIVRQLDNPSIRSFNKAALLKGIKKKASPEEGKNSTKCSATSYVRELSGPESFGTDIEPAAKKQCRHY